MSRINRRDFLKKVIKTTSIGFGIPALASIANSCANIGGNIFTLQWSMESPKDVVPVKPVSNNIRSTIVIATDSRSVDKNTKIIGVEYDIMNAAIDAVTRASKKSSEYRKDHGINKEVVHNMLVEGIKNLTGESTIKDSWHKIFPEYRVEEAIGIKVNCVNPRLPTHPELIDVIIKSLIEDFNVKDNNIIVWDNLEDDSARGIKRCGYNINNTNKGVRFITTQTDGIGYDYNNKAKIPSQKLSVPLSKIVTEMCDYLISVPVLKGNKISGMTGGMKNFYGAIPLNDKWSFKIIHGMHKRNCNPQIAELYNNPIIKDKTKLLICDALLIIYGDNTIDNPQLINNQLLLSTDPVALDYTGLMIIEEKRKEREMPSILRSAKYIQTAAEMGLGTNNPEQMEIQNINLG